jgi:hypothetical protein
LTAAELCAGGGGAGGGGGDGGGATNASIVGTFGICSATNNPVTMTATAAAAACAVVEITMGSVE